jgi:glycosyltransferase involved in cell wall biosynthesis
VDLYHCNQSEKDISRLELFSEEEKTRLRSFVIPFPDSGIVPGHYLRESYEYSKRILTAFKLNGKVDYIYAKGFTAWALLDQKRKGVNFPPVGVNFHGYEMFQQPGSLKTRLEQYLLKGPVRFLVTHADQVFSYGGKITSIIRSLGVSREKIIEIPTGIDSSWLNEGALRTGKERRFIFVGRYERRKGIEELNEVLKRLHEYKFQFEFVGPIPQSRQITMPGISYTGNITDPETMRSILCKADVLVCPSHSEGMPNVILEGMACGLAIIGTDVGAVQAMVGESNGWLIRPHSEDDLFEAIRDALTISPERLNEKRSDSLERVKDQFLWDKLIQMAIRNISERIEK